MTSISNETVSNAPIKHMYNVPTVRMYRTRKQNRSITIENNRRYAKQWTRVVEEAVASHSGLTIQDVMAQILPTYGDPSVILSPC